MTQKMTTTSIAIEKLTPAEYNPRTVTDTQLDAICRSIVEFGIVDPLIARKEDGLIVGGHQRYRAIRRLLAGEYKVRGKKVEYALPGGKVPVVLVEGLDDDRAKILNLALNRITGDWEHQMLAELLSDLHDKVSEDALLLSGFGPAEIADYLDIADETGADGNGDGTMPAPPTKAPSITLDFTSKELRDAVKQFVAAATTPGKLGGDVLAEKLGVTAAPPQRARRTRAAARA